MNTSDKISNYAQDTADSISSATHKARATVNKKSEQLLHAEQQAEKNCRGYIRTNPVTTLGIAVAAGFLLGGLLGITRR
jgi:ElaB/YqjD/DUF883 family membrane-anchored ribosome-binding protein